MTANEVRYTLDNTWDKARQRLSMLEGLWDEGTRSRLSALGVGRGWRCLELGAGGGSIARWLCDRVGPAGVVTAVDLDPRFVEADPRANMEILRHDVVAHGVPGDGYDLIHTRALLMHLPTRDELITDVVRHLRPGGVVLLEEADCYPYATADSRLYVELWDACCALAEKAGGDWFWARQVPARLAAAGAVGVTAVVDSHLCPGGAPWAELTAITWEQLTPMLLAEGISEEQIARGTAEVSDPTRWFPSCALIATAGRRPS